MSHIQFGRRCTIPIENERKFVLRLDTPRKRIEEAADQSEHINQAYLIVDKKQSVRIRKCMVFSPNKCCECLYKFTFKQDVGKKTIEVETELNLDDYNMLVKQSILRFEKWRYTIDGWEIDFFQDNKNIYFVQAEIELPVRKKKPDEIHPLVQEYLIHTVKRGDGRFSSKKLGDPKYAQKLMRSLLEIKV